MRRCLAQQPDNRYPSAVELAQELKNLLELKPISARHISLSEKAWLWCKRKPFSASIGFVLLLSIVLGAWLFHVTMQYGNRLRYQTITYRIDQTLDERWGWLPTTKEYRESVQLPPGMVFVINDIVTPMSLWNPEHTDGCSDLELSYLYNDLHQIVGVQMTYTLKSGAWYDRYRGKLRGNLAIPCQLTVPWYAVLLGKLP